MDQTSGSRVDRLAEELAGLLSSGVSLKALPYVPSLLALETVKAKALSDDVEDLSASASGVLKETVARVDGASHGPLSALLGISPELRGQSLTRRRAVCAERSFVSADHFRKVIERQKIVELAEDLISRDSTFRARLAHKLAQPSAVESRLEINWLERHEAYRRMWTPISGMRNDLLVLMGYLHAVSAEQLAEDSGDIDRASILGRVTSLLYWRARFTSALDQFIEQFGGLWLLSDPEKEAQVAQHIRLLDSEQPNGLADDSWLRLLLGRAKSGEFDSFEDLFLASENGQVLSDLWLDWARKCTCQLAPTGLVGLAKVEGTNRGSRDDKTLVTSPRSSCQPHRWLTACEGYITLIDEDWVQVADWYRPADSPSFPP